MTNSMMSIVVFFVTISFLEIASTQDTVSKETVLSTPMKGWNHEKCADPKYKHKYRVNDPGKFYLEACCSKNLIKEHGCIKDRKTRQPVFDPKCKAEMLLNNDCCLVSRSLCFNDWNKNGSLPCCRQVKYESGVILDQVNLCKPRGTSDAEINEGLEYCEAPESGWVWTDVLKFKEENPKDKRVNYTAGILNTKFCCQGFGNKYFHIGHFTSWGRHQEMCCSNVNATYKSLNQVKDACCLLPRWIGKDSSVYKNEVLTNSGIKCCKKGTKPPNCGGLSLDATDPDISKKEKEFDDQHLKGMWTDECKIKAHDWQEQVKKVEDSGETVYKGTFKSHDTKTFLERSKENRQACKECFPAAF